MPPINLKTLDVVQGARLTRTLQGKDLDGTIPTVFLNTDVLTGTVWMAQGQPAVISFTPTWFNAGLCQFTFSLTEQQTSSLAIDAEYNLQVFASRAGVTYCIGWVLLQVGPAAGSQAAATPPDLIGGAYAQRMLGQLGLSEAALEILPDLISAVSGAIRDYCNRQFRTGTWVETVPVELDGTIRLSQVPIQAMQRIQCSPRVALTVANPSASVQQAWVYGTATGDGLVGYTLTALVLNWTSNGTLTSTPLAIVAGQTVNDLAALVNAVGSGWTATADPVLGAYPSLELIDVLDSRGAGPGDQPGGGAQFRVYSSIATGARPDPDGGMETGIWCVGRLGYGGGPDALWGLLSPSWDGGSGGRDDGGTVRATYVGGLASVPADIQRAAAELVALELHRLKADMTLQSETGAEYSYVLNEAMLDAFPPYVRNAIRRWQVTNA